MSWLPLVEMQEGAWVLPQPASPLRCTLPTNVKLVNTPMLEVSSTFIRDSLKQGKDVRYFLHPKVWEKISCIFKGNSLI